MANLASYANCFTHREKTCKFYNFENILDKDYLCLTFKF